MITPYYDRELAVYQTVKFIYMRVGESKSPQGPQWEKEPKEEEKCWGSEIPPLRDTAGYKASAIRQQILPGLLKSCLLFSLIFPKPEENTDQWEIYERRQKFFF